MVRTVGFRVALATMMIAVGLLTGCSGDPPTGPVEITYGRDTCDLCRMIISDPRYASQIRGGPGHKAYKFDDIGDALLFLRLQPWKDEPQVEIWVMDMDDGKAWLDARTAHYLSGKPSPMAHGFGAVAEARDGSISFDDMRRRLLQRGAAALCLPGALEAGDRGHE